MGFFIKEMLSSKDNISSKRIMGVLLITSFIFILICSIFMDINSNAKELAIVSISSGISLLGLGIIDKNLKINKNK